MWYLYLSDTPRSQLEIAWRVTPSLSAASSCVKPQSFLYFFNVAPNSIKLSTSIAAISIVINIEIKNFENFFASFTIEQIGKEFDLIKPDKDNFVLNIELKSENVGVMYVKIFIVAKGISSRYGCNSGRKGEWLIS